MSASGLIRAAAQANDAAMTLGAVLAALAAAALLHPAPRARARAWSEALDRSEPSRVWLGVLLASALLASALAVLKACQYRALQLTLDTSVMLNSAANFIRGDGLASTILGEPSILAIHFAFLVPVLFSPILLFWPSALPLLALQSAAIASIGPAAFLIARRRTGSASLGLAAALLAWSHAGFHEMALANLDNALFAPALFLWGLAAWESRRRAAAGAVWLLGLATKENFTLSLAGLGLWHGLAGPGPWKRRALQGLGAVIAMALALWLELRVIAAHGTFNERYWSLYSHLGATREEVLKALATEPVRVLAHVLRPSHLAGFAGLIAGMAFLPLASPAALLAVLVPSAQFLLASHYKLQVHVPAYLFGPLVFASVAGLAAGGRRAASRPWIFAAVFAASAWGLASGGRTVDASYNSKAWEHAPPLARRIPPAASVWADEHIATWLAARSQVKSLAFAEATPDFAPLLFRPEYVLTNPFSLLARGDRARLLSFLAREGYAVEAASGPLILLKDPDAPRSGPSPALALDASPDDDARARAYLAAILDTPGSRTRLAAYPPDLRLEARTAAEHAVLARLLAERGLAALAIAHNKAALALSPDFLAARNNLANALLQAGDLAGAERELREALRRHPDEARLAYNLGNALLRQGKGTEAAQVLERASPKDARIHNSLGAALLTSGRTEEAARSFERALELEPGLADARENLEQARRRRRSPQ